MTLCIYDGDCGFCTRCVEWVQRRSDVEFVPFQRADLAGYGITLDEAAAALQWVNDDGTVVSGAAAVAAVLRECRGGWRALGFLMRVPGINWVAEVAYRAVARNRHRLPGPAACAIEPADDSTTTES